MQIIKSIHRNAEERWQDNVAVAPSTSTMATTSAMLSDTAYQFICLLGRTGAGQAVLRHSGRHDTH